MNAEHDRADSHRSRRLAEKFHDKNYRDGYVAAHTRSVLARQMRNFRGQRSQAEYAALIAKRQTIISRLESSAYGSWTLRTMLQIARKENVAILMRFVDFPTFLSFTDDMSDEALLPQSYNEAEIDRFAAYQGRQASYYDILLPPDINKATSMGRPTLYEDIFFATPSGQQISSIATVGGTLTVGTPVGTWGASGSFLMPFQSVSNFIGGGGTIWPTSHSITSPPPIPRALQSAHAEIRRLDNLIQNQSKLIADQRQQIENLQKRLPKIAALQVPGSAGDIAHMTGVPPAYMSANWPPNIGT
jgi:hypothetical protein